MTDTMKLNEQRERGGQASAVLDNPAVKEALDKMDAEMIAQFKNSALGDDEERYHARVALGVLARFKRILDEYVFTGDAAINELTKLEEDKAA